MKGKFEIKFDIDKNVYDSFGEMFGKEVQEFLEDNATLYERV